MTDTDSAPPRPGPDEPDLPPREEVEAALEGLVHAVLPRDPRRPCAAAETRDPRASHLAGKFPTGPKIAAKREH